MKTAFVLSGGGSLGAVQVGMLQALADRQVTPDLLVGTSAGAVNAAFVGARGTGRSALDDLGRLWAGLRRRDVFRVRAHRSLAALAGRCDSLCTDRGLRSLIERCLRPTRFEQLAIPVHLVATDLLSGEEVLMSDGEIASALLASTAIPGVLPTVRREGRTLVDGGLANNAAISQASALGADRIYVLPTGYACALPRAPGHPIAVALHGLSLLLQQRLIADVAHYADRVELVVLPPLCPLAVSAADFSQARMLTARARDAAGAWLDSGAWARPHPERTLALHGHRPRVAQPARCAADVRPSSAGIVATTRESSSSGSPNSA